MRFRGIRILGFLSGLGLGLCLVLLFELRHELDSLVQELDVLIAKQHKQIQSLQQKTAVLEKELIRLRPLIARLLPKEKSKIRSKVHLGLMRNGLYVLDTEIELPSMLSSGLPRKKSVTIYHIKTRLDVGDFSGDINIGLATSGLTSRPIFYLDYDSDGTVDAEIMQQFAQYLPLGGIILKSLDADESQVAYDALLLMSHRAAYSSLSEIQEKGGKVANILWSFVQERSEEMAAWIKQASDSESNRKVDSSTVPSRLEN